jgi:arginyl-tRNA synthetase
LYLGIQEEIARKYIEVVRDVFGLDAGAPGFDIPPQPEMGDLSLAAAFELAKKLRRAPRQIAEQIAPRILPVEGVERVSVAGGGYLNFHLDRAALASALFRRRSGHEPAAPLRPGKVLVEHTSINPNKAAHIGHLRNAVLGDTFARLLRFRRHRVEVQNYIDNTGVQVADVVVGFLHLERKSVAEVQALVNDPAVRFDYYCWDLYARVFRHYEENRESLALRAETLKAIEENQGEAGQVARIVSTAIVKKHLATMLRLNVEYDLLVEESEILRLNFWKAAFEEMKRIGAIRHEASGKNAGCWVMSLNEVGDDGDEDAGEDVKIIVRSNGTVTYVGKDIAYHLWKFGRLGKDFIYAPFEAYPSGKTLWLTAARGNGGAPEFGHASSVYSVIDTRQNYLQKVVSAALQAMGHQDAAANLHHFAYEVVGLSPACADELGFGLTPEDRARSYVEVSGRKGLGLKADDLMDRLIEKATEEVRSRQMTTNPAGQSTYGRMIAVGALRYFLSKFSRHVIITFDFKEALAFEGETGPYLQYTTVRARNIFRKYKEAHPEFDFQSCEMDLGEAQLKAGFEGEDGSTFWQLIALAAQLELVAEQAIASVEPAVVAKYAFRLAQSFNNFYHRCHILSEPDPARQKFLLYLAYIASETLATTLDLLGIEVPDRM